MTAKGPLEKREQRGHWLGVWGGQAGATWGEKGKIGGGRPSDGNKNLDQRKMNGGGGGRGLIRKNQN